jgi:hypothetical protein
VDPSMSSSTREFAELVIPLGDDEERMAVETALAYLELHRPLVYGVELRFEKSRGALPRRQISVVVAELDEYLAHEVVVENDGNVVSADARPDLVPAFTDEEVAEAAVLARADSRLAEVVRRWGVRFAVFYPSRQEHGGAAPGVRARRRVGLHFFDARSVEVVPLTSVVVDLTSHEVVSIERHDRSL